MHELDANRGPGQSRLNPAGLLSPGGRRELGPIEGTAGAKGRIDVDAGIRIVEVVWFGTEGGLVMLASGGVRGPLDSVDEVVHFQELTMPLPVHPLESLLLS